MGKPTRIAACLITLLAGAHCGPLEQPRTVSNEEIDRKLAAQNQMPEPSPVSKEAQAEKGPEPLVPRISVQDEKGKQLDDATQKAFTPASAMMRECSPSKRGVITIRITYDPKRTEMGVEPSSNVDGAAGRCVLETLSTIDVDDALRSQNPADRPAKGFTSYVRVEW